MNRIFVIAPLALVVSTFFLAASVSAAAAGEAACSTMPQSIRSIAANADAAVAKKALKYSKTGVLLCEAGNERAAQKKFEIAFKTLGTSATEYAQIRVTK